jgi:hypothetical protein
MSADAVNAEMKRHAHAAVEMVMAEYGNAMKEQGLKLDFSEKTIGLVESILDGFYKDGDRSHELLEKIALLFGAYIGETIRDCFPEARWVPAKDGGIGIPFIQLDDIQLYPCIWCYKRAHNGPQDSVVDKYLAFRKEMDKRRALT